MEARPIRRGLSDWARGILASVVLGLVALPVIAVIVVEHLLRADAARFRCPTITGNGGQVLYSFFDGVSCLYDASYRREPTKGPFDLFQPFWSFVGSVAAVVGLVAVVVWLVVRAFRPAHRPPGIPRWTGVKA